MNKTIYLLIALFAVDLVSATKQLTWCARGKYSPEGVTCDVCPYGKYTDIENLRACKACAVGRSTGGTQSTSSGHCNHCAAGYYYVSYRSQCIACPAGQYRAEAAHRTTW